VLLCVAVCCCVYRGGGGSALWGRVFVSLRTLDVSGARGGVPGCGCRSERAPLEEALIKYLRERDDEGEGLGAEEGGAVGEVDSGWVHDALINGGATAVVRVQVLITVETLPTKGMYRLARVLLDASLVCVLVHVQIGFRARAAVSVETCVWWIAAFSSTGFSWMLLVSVAVDAFHRPWCCHCARAGGSAAATAVRGHGNPGVPKAHSVLAGGRPCHPLLAADWYG
jgi:hypothetical protein